MKKQKDPDAVRLGSKGGKKNATIQGKKKMKELSAKAVAAKKEKRQRGR